jgi:hypothetical protein
METDAIITKDREKLHKLTPKQAEAHRAELRAAWERLRGVRLELPPDEERLADEEWLARCRHD